MRVYRFEEPLGDSLGPPRPVRRRRRRYPVVLALLGLALIGVLVGGTLYLGRDTGAQIPAGTRIDGVDVGELTVPEAKAKVRAHGRQLVDRGLVFVADGNRFEVEPAAIQLRPNAQIAVRTAQADSTFLERVSGRLGFGATRDIPLTYLYNRRELAQTLLPVRQAVTIAPRNAAIATDDKGRFAVTPAAHRKSVTALRSFSSAMRFARPAARPSSRL